MSDRRYARITAANNAAAAEAVELTWAHRLMLEAAARYEDIYGFSRAEINAQMPAGEQPVTEAVSALVRHLVGNGLVEECHDDRDGGYYYRLTGVGTAALRNA